MIHALWYQSLATDLIYQYLNHMEIVLKQLKNLTQNHALLTVCQFYDG